MSETFIQRLPDYKEMVIRSIKSVVTTDQLMISWEFIELFDHRFRHKLAPGEFEKHINDLLEEYMNKSTLL